MNLSDLLLALEYQGIELSVHEGALGYRAPKGTFTEALRDEVKRHKEDLITLIGKSAAHILHQPSVDEAVDELPLTPWHGWYLETFDPRLHKWAVTHHVHIGADVDFDLINEAVRLVMLRYDTFRQRMYKNKSGRWALRMLPDATPPKINLYHIQEGIKNLVEHLDKDIQNSLNITDGPVLYVALCKNSTMRDDLVISFHHNIVDAHSSKILVKEMLNAHERLLTKQDIESRPNDKSSYASYINRLHKYMNRPMFFAKSISYWGNFISTPTPRIPIDFVGGQHTTDNSRTVSIYIAASDFPSNNTHLMNDSLVIAACAAVAGWSGEDHVAIDVEHHGRGGHIPGVDFLDTIGPTTFKFPVWLDFDQDYLSSTESFELLRERIRDVTQYGLGYGFLRHLHPDHRIRSEFKKIDRPQVFFNNRTIFPKGGQKEKEWVPSQRKSGELNFASNSDPRSNDPYSHEIVIECDRVPDGIEIAVKYSAKIHKDSTAADLVNMLFTKLKRISEICD